MKRNTLFSLLFLIGLLQAADPSMAAVKLSQSHSLFQLAEVRASRPVLVSEKGDTKCGAGACGATKKSKSAEKPSKQKSTAKPQSKTDKADTKCGAGACGSTKLRTQRNK